MKFSQEPIKKPSLRSNLIYDIPLKDRDLESQENLKRENSVQSIINTCEQSEVQRGNRTKLLHQMSSGFGTQQSKDDPTITESMELRTMDTERLSQHHTSDSKHFDEAYLKYQKSLLNRSPSYRKSIDDISLKSDGTSQLCSQNTPPPSSAPVQRNANFLKSPESISFRKNQNMSRVASDASLNTLSLEQDMNNMNLRDELLNCEKRELFQFLSEDHDNSTNYFSDTVGFGSAVIDMDTDSLISSHKDEDQPKRKVSNVSLRSNLSNISNSVFQAIEKRSRTGTNTSENLKNALRRSREGGKFEENEPLVQRSEFDDLIKNFDNELQSLHSLSVGCRSAKGSDTDIAKVILRTPKSNRNSGVDNLKRRSLEKQSKVSDEEFCVPSVELRKSLDHIPPPLIDLKTLTSPVLRKKNSFQNSFDRIKRLSLIERVEEMNEEEKHIMRVESERLPRKKLSEDLIDTQSLMSSTKSEENIFIARAPSRRESNLPNRADIREFQRNLPAELKNTIMKKVTLPDFAENSDSHDLPLKKKGKLHLKNEFF